MPTITYREAGKLAVQEAMQADPSVWCLGEDLGRGGVFGQYAGLETEFGDDRICSTPISEAAIMGAAVGAAMAGTRPIVEMRFADFALCAIDELVNQAAKARYMFGGQVKVPITVREPMGMWRSSAAQHSQSLEAWYTHIPGLVVVAPSTPADNYGLLSTSIKSDDPVVYMEHKNLWDVSGDVTLGQTLPLGKAHIAKHGGDVSVVTWSAQVHTALEAAEILATEGIEIEVIDLRSLWPWDEDTVAKSLAKTGRLVVCHEAVGVSGFGAEILATISERYFGLLKRPPIRVTAPRIPISYAPNLENEVKVTAKDISNAIRQMD
ncbi:MAG: alpha-ketoacid dehydrogenase subunit beta [Alphaproteobacteria bacterium]|jgi:pyruvate/2-oxoglutarate/acetoin dehydrogenase E1 component